MRSVRRECVHGDGGRGLLGDVHARALDFGRQKRLGALDRVLHVDHCKVGVRSARERQGAGVAAETVAGRGVVGKPLDHVQLVLDGRRHGLDDGLRVRPGVACGNVYLRWGDFGELLHREVRKGDDPRDCHHDCDDGGKSRPLDKHAGERTEMSVGRAHFASLHVTAAPSETLCVPPTITVSPALRPDFTNTRSGRRALSSTARRSALPSSTT